MSKPVIADITPQAVTVEGGVEYYFCACGRSKSQPYCDGSHKGTGIDPIAFTPGESGEVWLCQCKHTCDTPYCDGSHKRFSQDDIGREGD